MFVGHWQTNYKYTRGDIVLNSVISKHFICSLDHVSTDFCFPCQDDLYWILIDLGFLGRTKSVAFINDSPFASNVPISEEKTIENKDKCSPKQKQMKRKLEEEENCIKEFKKKKTNDSVECLRDQLLLLDMDVATKAFVVDKYDNTSTLTGSEYSKGMNWLKTVVSIPHGKIKGINITKNDNVDVIQHFFKNIRAKLDKYIYGLEDVKQEILEFVARKITNPKGKGEVLALCGSKGVGKTKLILSLAEALELGLKNE